MFCYQENSFLRRNLRRLKSWGDSFSRAMTSRHLRALVWSCTGFGNMLQIAKRKKVKKKTKKSQTRKKSKKKNPKKNPKKFQKKSQTRKKNSKKPKKNTKKKSQNYYYYYFLVWWWRHQLWNWPILLHLVAISSLCRWRSRFWLAAHEQKSLHSY